MIAEDQKYLAALLRETADLVERGLVSDFAVEWNNHLADVPLPSGRVERRPTGQQTVVITLHGNPKIVAVRESTLQGQLPPPKR